MTLAAQETDAAQRRWEGVIITGGGEVMPTLERCISLVPLHQRLSDEMMNQLNYR